MAPEHIASIMMIGLPCMSFGSHGAGGARPLDPRGEALARFVGTPKAAGKISVADRAAAYAAIQRSAAEIEPTEIDRCSSRPIAERRADPACSLGVAAKASLEGQHDLARAALADMVAALAFPIVYDGTPLTEPQKDDLYRRVAGALRQIVLVERGDATIVDDVRQAFDGIDLDEVAPEKCKSSPLVRDLAEGTLDAQDSFCSATRADFDLFTVEVTVTFASPARGRHGTSVDEEATN